MRITWTLTVIGVLCITAISYLAACISVKTRLQSSYDSIQIGDPANAVIARLGSPSVKEISEKPFYRYASSECRKPCVERWWYENRLALDIEAWSVSIGSDDRVVSKYHWVSS